jgi:riboflavin synthase
MYTGITRGTFPVVLVQRKPDLLRFSVGLSPDLRAGLEVGASVSIDGVCQTVVALDGNHVEFEAIAETLERTTLAELAEGVLVSVERSARLGDEVGGHELAGHVLGTGTVVAVESHGDVHRTRIGVPAAWMKYILPKGFIAVNGSSFTVGETDPDGGFDVHLIPETLRRTRLGNKRPGDRVNIELDARTVAIVDTVERVLAERERLTRSHQR